jgi:hypothetical protein
MHACVCVYVCKAVPGLRWLVAGLPPWRSRFKPGSVHVGFVVDSTRVPYSYYLGEEQ